VVVGCSSNLGFSQNKPNFFATPEALMNALKTGQLQSSADDPLVAIAFDNGVVVTRAKFAARVAQIEISKAELGFTFQYMRLSVAKQKFSDLDLNFEAKTRLVETSLEDIVHLSDPYSDKKSLGAQFDSAAYWRCIQMAYQTCAAWPPGFMRTGCIGGAAGYCAIVAAGG
jgi:hypothetical protein